MTPAKPARGQPRNTIELTPERRARLVRLLQDYFAENFDDDLSEFRASGLLDFVLQEVGPSVYNQAVRDTYAYVQERLADLEADVYATEKP